MMRNYIKSRWVVLAGPFALLVVAVLMTALLFQPWSLLFNTVFVGMLPVIIFWSIDFLSFRKRDLILKQQSRSAYVDLNAIITNDPIENHYQEIISKEIQEIDELKTQLIDLKIDTYNTLQLWTHQIKTPLTALDFLLQIKPIDDQSARIEVDKIDRYLKVMLNYLKLTTVNTDLVLRRISLTDLVQKQVRELAKLFIAKDLKVTIKDLPEVVSDPQWLKFIFEQILTNSIKYTPEGEIKIYAEGDTVIFADTGIGILPEDLPRIFEQGYSGYNGRENQKASGLGLYLSSEIAKKIGLELTAKSTVGVGTEIAVHFPQSAWLAE